MKLRARTALRRRIGTVLSLLYLVVGVLVPLAHAQFEQASAARGDEAHMHAPGKDCPPPHDEQHCPACQFAGLKNHPTPAAPAAVALAQRVQALALGEVFSLPRHPVRTPGPRGPPSV